MKRLRNFTVKGLGEVGVRIISSATVFAFAHVLGATAFGEYSTAFAFVTMFAVGVDLGNSAIVMREIARSVEKRRLVLGTGNLLKIGATIAIMVAIHFSGLATSFGRHRSFLIDTLGFVSISYVLIDYLGIVLAGKEEFGWETFLKLACRILISGAGIYVLLRTKALEPVAGTMAAAALVSIFFGAFVVSKRFGGFPILFDSATFWRVVKSSAPVLGFIVFWTFYDNQDILILNQLKVPSKEIGLFWSATKVLDVLKVLPVVLVTIFLPELARFAQARESFIQTARRVLLATVGLILLIVPAVWVLAPWIERVLYGPQFVEAAPLLRLLTPALGLAFFNVVCFQMLIAKDQENQIFPGAILACLSNLSFSFWWIPTYGAAGACYALVASEGLFFLFLFRHLLQAVPGLLNPFRKTFG